MEKAELSFVGNHKKEEGVQKEQLGGLTAGWFPRPGEAVSD